MPTFTVFPNIKPSSGGKGNPYINDFISAINNEEGCKVVNESHKNPLLSILRPSRWGDVFIFNWFESIPDFKYGYLQSLFAILLIFILKIKGKKIIWILHNKKPHSGNKKIIKRILTYLIAKESDYIITHASEGVNLINDRYKFTVGKTYYIDHPTKDRLNMINKLQEEKKYDLLIWGNIIGYKGVYQYLKYIKEKNINDIRTCVVGNCTTPKIASDIESVAGENTTLIFRGASFEELAGYIASSEFVLMPYLQDSILSSGILMDSLSFGAKVIGPNTGSFKDYAKDKNLNVYVFDEYKDISEIVKNKRGIKISYDCYKRFLDNNNWKSFIHKALKLVINKA